MRLHVSNLCKTFGEHRVLNNVTLEFDAVQSLVLIGPSGGGKSTLLRILAGLEYPDRTGDDAPSVVIDGQPVVFEERALAAHRRAVGTVFQAFNLFPHLTALRNVTLPLEKVHQVPPAEARERAMAALERFQLGRHAGKKPAELSGGQRQRVAIARAIAIRPRLLFFDEPTSSLDPEMTGEVLEIIEELKEEGRDFVLVTHEMGFARRVADAVAVLADGRIVESGPATQVFDTPAQEISRAFFAKVLRY